MLEDKLYTPNPKKSIGTPYGCIEHSPEPYVNFSDQFSYLFNPNYSSNSSVDLNYSPGPVIKKQSLYELDVRNAIRNQNGEVIVVIGSLLGFNDPTLYCGTPTIETGGESLPVFVSYSVEGHELGHEVEGNEDANRKQDKNRGTDAYNWYWGFTQT